jgi:polyisoprenoid-binding protein YceI
MRKLALFALLAALCAAPFALELRADPSAAAPRTYNVDSGHSAALFRVKHSGVAWFYGRFNDIAGTVMVDDADPTKSTVELEIAVDSVDTGMEKLDRHLKSADFFSADEFAKITFKSKKVAKKSGEVFSVTGDLTIRGTTKEVVLDVERTGAAEGERGAKAGFHTTLDIKRSEYGVSYMVGESLGDDVHLIVSLECNGR